MACARTVSSALRSSAVRAHTTNRTRPGPRGAPRTRPASVLPTRVRAHTPSCPVRAATGEDDFPTRMLEVRLHTAGAILLSAKKKKKGAGGREIAHNGTYSDDDDDSEGGSDDDDDDDEE
mmetsp:Transcript_10788/g.28002  ORF Transcript_10788/g.28002 Transcript_10788/m.28002 type:complete len:120 (+) Transcript_10788:629-988(+)